MKSEKILDKNIVFVYFLLIFGLAFLFPSKIVSDATGLAIDSYIYGLLVLSMSFLVISCNMHKTKIRNLGFFIFTLILVVVQKDFTPLQLLGIMVLENVADDSEYYLSIFERKIFKWIGFGGIVFYSACYFGDLNRFAFLGVADANISGMGIFLFGSIYRRIDEKFSNMVWIIGVFTLSRNYLLALVVYYICSYLLNKKNYTKLLNFITFNKVGIVTSGILYFVAILFQKYYVLGRVMAYVESGIKRFSNFLDVSNYHRFAVNKGVVDIYANNPKFLITGIPNKDFSRYYYEVCRILGVDFSNDRPHNFFYSYLQIYGLWSIFIFAYMSYVFEKIVNKNNFPVFAAALVYAVFLGMGFSGYWLWIFGVSLLLNGKDEEVKN